jgi:hypothetical protein
VAAVIAGAWRSPKIRQRRSNSSCFSASSAVSRPAARTRSCGLPSWLTVTLVRDGWPVSVRLLDAGVAGSLEEMRREIASTAVFWRDRLAGQKLASAVVHAADPWFEGLAVDLERAFGVRAARAQPPAGFTVAGVPPAIERLAAPALTLLGAA